MQQTGLWLLLSLSFVLHTLQFSLGTVVCKPQEIKLYDKWGDNPVAMSRADLVNLLRLERQAGLSVKNKYMLRILKQEGPLSADYVKTASGHNSYGPYETMLEELRDLNLAWIQKGLWVLTDRGKYAAEIPE